MKYKYERLESHLSPKRDTNKIFTLIPKSVKIRSLSLCFLFYKQSFTSASEDFQYILFLVYPNESRLSEQSH